MASIALIDDDPTEALVISGLLEHGAAGHTMSHYPTVEGFAAEPDAARFDLVLLDRRVPPHQSFRDSLAALSDSAYLGPVALISASPCVEAGLVAPGPIIGPINKADLLTPDALERLVDRALDLAAD